MPILICSLKRLPLFYWIFHQQFSILDKHKLGEMASSDTGGGGGGSFDIASPINFYIYYSTSTLIGEWLIAPFLFYIILTKSKQLGSFKWLIFNHSFWCLATSSIVCSLKPVFLPPAAGGFGVGIFRNKNVRCSIICLIFGFGFLCNCFFGLALTLGNRYTVAFASTGWRKLFLTKKFWTFILLLHIASFALIGWACMPMLGFDHDSIVNWAVTFDPALEQFSAEQSLLIVDKSYIRYPLYFISASMIIFYLGSAFIVWFFITKILRQRTQLLTSRVQRSLILSSVVQVLLTNIFSITPVFVNMMSVAFDLQNMAIFETWLLNIFVSHCILDFIATLYFVTPYRRYISSLLGLNQRRKLSSIGTISLRRNSQLHL